MTPIAAILGLGANADQPDHLQNKIRITNFIALAFFLICIPFAWLTETYFSEILLYPVLFMVISVLIVLANYFCLYSISRFMACVIYINLYTIWHCYLLPDTEPLIASLYAVQIVFWMVPWLLFDLNEPKSLLVYTLYYLLVSLSIPDLNNVLSRPFDVENLKSGWLCSLIFFLAGISISAPLFFFMYTNYANKKQLDSMVDKLTAQNSKLEESEIKTRSYLAEIENTRKAERQRNWINDGQAMFNRQLQEAYIKGEEIFDKVISDFVRYIGANQCALFLLREDFSGNAILSLASCYAYERKKFVEKNIGIGEGIVGQAFLEKEVVVLTDIPKNYIKITSGLGEATPRQLVIVPLIYLDKTIGVVEVATFNVLENYVVDFITKFASSLAIAVHAVQTTKLLTTRSA
ncbi:MAG TPA: GAF domain-containing protein [Chryseosolibacter sp.]